MRKLSTRVEVYLSLLKKFWQLYSHSIWSSQARDPIWATAATYATVGTMPDHQPTALGQGSNPHLRSNLSRCNQILHPLHHGGNSKYTLSEVFWWNCDIFDSSLSRALKYKYALVQCSRSHYVLPRCPSGLIPPAATSWWTTALSPV